MSSVYCDCRAAEEWLVVLVSIYSMVLEVEAHVGSAVDMRGDWACSE